MNRRLAMRRLTDELDERVNGAAAKTSLKAMLERERKRKQARRSAKKHATGKAFKSEPA